MNGREENKEETHKAAPEDDHFKLRGRPVWAVINCIGVLKVKGPPFPSRLSDSNTTDVDAVVILRTVPMVDVYGKGSRTG